MVAAHRALPDLHQLDPTALKALILSQHEQLLSRDAEIEHLKLLIAKLRRMQFGRKSEKLDRQIEQLELRLDELQATPVENTAASHTPAVVAPVVNVAVKPARRPLPEHLPREVRKYLPKQAACPDCGGELKLLGEDVSEILEYVPARFKVIRQVRPKLACACCERIVQAEAPSRPIERGVAGPGLLAHALASKYCDHLPLYRQLEMYARKGVELGPSTLADCERPSEDSGCPGVPLFADTSCICQWVCSDYGLDLCVRASHYVRQPSEHIDLLAEMKRRKLQDGWEEIFLETWALHEDIERARVLAERPPPRQEASGN